MFTTTARSEPVQPTSRSEHIGIGISRGGEVILDEYFFIDSSNTNPMGGPWKPEMSKFITVSTTGNVVFQYFDGNYDYLLGAIPGFLYPIWAIRVVTSHNFSNIPDLQTTAVGIHWYGGV